MSDYDIQNAIGGHGLSGVPPTQSQNIGCIHVKPNRVIVGTAPNRVGGVQIDFPDTCILSSPNEYSDIHPPLISDKWADDPSISGDEGRFDDYKYYG